MQSLRLLYYDLVFNLLFNHWKFFTGSRVNDLGSNDNVSEEFLESMKIFGRSLQEKNVDTVKQIIKNLNTLNERNFLFAKPFFRRHLFFPFIEILFGLVASGSHSIIQEDIFDLMVSMIKHDTLFFTDVSTPNSSIVYSNPGL